MKSIWNLPKIEFIPLSDLNEERTVALVTSPPAWDVVKNQLRGVSPASIAFIQDATLVSWNKVSTELLASQPEVIYSAGGGLAADTAKYLAKLFHLPMVCLPTTLSVDAFFTPAAGIRENGCVKYIETPPPEQVILDLDVIAAAPKSIRASGITDVMSISTGTWDWKYAHGLGKNPEGMEFIPWIYDSALAILRGVLDCAESAGRGEKDGLKRLLDCICMEVQLCNQIGHSRPEEGSEHYFAYCVENYTGPGWPHADLLGPGILLMAELQGQDTRPLRKAMEACHVPLGRITNEIKAKAMAQLPDYCHKHNLPYGLSHGLEEKE